MLDGSFWGNRGVLDGSFWGNRGVLDGSFWGNRGGFGNVFLLVLELAYDKVLMEDVAEWQGEAEVVEGLEVRLVA